MFLPLATAVLQSATRATAQARSAAEPGRITIGCISNLIVTPAVRELRHRHPDADVRTLHVDWDEPDGSRAPDGPLVQAVEDKIELIASGQARNCTMEMAWRLCGDGMEAAWR